MADFLHRNNNSAQTVKGVKGECWIEMCIIAELKIILHLNYVSYKQNNMYLLKVNLYAKIIKIGNYINLPG